ncbi:MAG: dTDP-4-dehydrorhamnose reductase [Synechocystis sp.]|nr:dTDP-4-dehydrorhamnose reductase [Synechocystis sp.]
MTKILLTGADGQVGQELRHTLGTLGTVQVTTRQTLDLSQPETIATTVQALSPDIIVNAAAYTAVDKAESDGDLAQQINGHAPQILAETAQAIGAYLVHLSTDYVFDGSHSSPYQTTDPTHPLGVYGQTKRAGEIGIEQSGCEYLILRTAWVYGVQGTGNFVKTMLRLGKDREDIRVVADQIGSPTWAKDIATAIAALIPKRARGIYHYTNSGVASWYDFAVAIFAEAQALGIPLQVNRVLPITTADYPTPAQRPAYSVLSHQTLIETLGEYPPHWRQSLTLMLKEGLAAGIF